MKHDLASLKGILPALPGVPAKGRLVRVVPHLDLGPKPNWLYTSGRPNRFNPRGVNCIYFGENREVAQAEYDEGWLGLVGATQPSTNYSAEIALRRILDTRDEATSKALDVEESIWSENWRMETSPTFTQLLGQAVNDTGLFSAIRYRSKAAASRGFVGTCLVIFPECIRSPDSVYILGPNNKPLQEWP